MRGPSRRYLSIIAHYKPRADPISWGARSAITHPAWPVKIVKNMAAMIPDSAPGVRNTSGMNDIQLGLMVKMWFRDHFFMGDREFPLGVSVCHPAQRHLIKSTRLDVGFR